MRYSKSKILFSILSILLTERAYGESNPSKQNIISSGIIVNSDDVSHTSENSTVENRNEEVATEAHLATSTGLDDNEVYMGVNFEYITNVSKTKLPKKFIRVIADDPNYEKGYFGGYYFIGNGQTDHFYAHGKYQKPSTNYYGNYNHKLEDKSALGYYLGFATHKMDHNEYFRHHNYTRYKVHHYFFKNSTMLPEQYVGADHLLHCAQNTSIFCPENTEAICLQNTTVWCASRKPFVKPCEVGDAAECVTTRLPCVKSDDANCRQMVEVVTMPCIAIIKILDPYEDKNGLTLISIAGTFVLSPVPIMSERTYCVTIVAEPSRD
ncbi:uncharacterized protein LOC123684509 [Harmonia axyridis]|uniref:uncharacterized protein LOC123684509 n=1 Tax=Harmonia axyridis TaxID=115357 RepID=UPI001E2754F4|nr:uncharacterized protein LOC123684509 [Harmonia axyridis]